MSAAALTLLEASECQSWEVLRALSQECESREAFQRDVLQSELGLSGEDAATLAARVWIGEQGTGSSLAPQARGL